MHSCAMVGGWTCKTLIHSSGSAKKRRAERSAEALAAGRITAQQLKRDNESFAFGPDRARVDWEVARTRH